MILFRTSMQTGADSQKVQWDADNRSALMTHRRFESFAPTDPNSGEPVEPVIAQFDVPNTAQGLARFLNQMGV